MMGTDMTQRQVDVCIVGAGTTGANLAYQLARRGRSVIVVERRSLDDGGAQWVNGVLPWQFRRAQLDPPIPPERFVDKRATHLVGPEWERNITLTPGPIERARMSLLGRRLRALATAAGATFVDRANDLEFRFALGRPTSVSLRCDGGPLTIDAALFVDASGRAAVVRHAVGHFEDWCDDLGPDELCLAGDYHFDVADPDGARSFLAAVGAAPGDHVNRIGRNGGWSTESYRVAADLASVDLLIGAVAAQAPGPLPELFDAVLAEQPWIGERTGGGSGLIPLRRPYARLTAPGAALVGDAACQVFCAHGSGVGMGLMAGTMLAEAVATAADPGDPAALWTYQHRFHRTYGPRLVAYDLFRRLSTGLGTEGVRRLLDAGVMSASSTAAAMDQRWETPSPLELARHVRRLSGDPQLAAFVGPAMARIVAAQRLAAATPKAPDLRALDRWRRRIDALVTAQDAARLG